MKICFSIFTAIFFAFVLVLGSVRAYAGPKELKGRVEVHIADGKGVSSEHAVLHESGTGKTYRLKGVGLTKIRSGSEIIARGSLSSRGGQFETRGFTVLTEAAPVVSAGVVKNVLIMVVNFADASLACSPTQVNESVLGATGSIAELYKEISFGALTYTGETTVPLTISALSTDACDTGTGMSNWRSQADSAARAAGYDPSAYADRLYFFPRNANCGGVAGVGTLGSITPWAVNAGYCNLPDVMAHELGHNLGLRHSAELGGGVYSDTSDIMGYGGVGLRQVNAYHRIKLGYLPSSKVLTPSASGIFKIAALELDPSTVSDPIALKLPNVKGGDFYYLFTRQRIGMDSNLSSTYSGGLAIGHASATQANCMTSGNGLDSCLVRRSLLDGETFTDPDSGFSVTQLSHGLDGVTVSLNFECTRQTPRLTVTPTSQLQAPGVQASYSIQVSNMDSPYCPSSQFDIFVDVPAGLTGALSSGTLRVLAGQSATTTLTAVAGIGIAEGSYPISILARDSADSARIASVAATLAVDATAPSAPMGLAAAVQTLSGKRVQVVLRWLASTDSNGIASYEVFRNGARLGQVLNTSFTDTSVGTGTQTYTVRAVDAAGNFSAESAPATVVITTTSRGRRK